MTPVKVLVTGAKGQLGREIVKILALRGYRVLSKGREELDITDFARVSECISGFNPDIVINCAAYNDVDGAESEWEGAFLVNGIGVKHLSIVCSRTGAELVHFSSDYVFDGLKGEPYTIADEPNPVNKYGESKLLGEECVKEHLERFYLIRTSWVFGDGRFSFPRKVIEWASRNRRLRIVDDQVSVPTYSVDLAKAVVDLIERRIYGIYHITNSGFCSRYRWAKFILEEMKWGGDIEPASSEEFKTPARRPGFSVLNNFPLKETLGYLLPSWESATERFLKESMGV